MQDIKKPLIVIAGPTASGKTGLSVALAKAINGAVISGDSIQVYKHMDIGTAKIMADEMKGVKHYLVDEIMPDEPYNVQVFQTKAKEAMDEIYAQGKVPILVGGTGFYIQSLVYDIDFEDTVEDPAYRACLEKLSRTMGVEAVHEKLKSVDPVSYDLIHPNNIKRVIRALEYYRQTGQPISEHNEEEAKKTSPYHVLFYVLTMERALLYERINHRVDLMVEKGLIDEVKALKKMGYHKGMVSMQGIGYKQILESFDGAYDLDEAIDLIKRDSRRFAKRQHTWFKREDIAKWLHADQFDMDYSRILDNILKDVEENGLLR